MIKNLTGLNWESVANFESVTIKNDWRLSDFLRMNTAWPISNNNETFREYRSEERRVGKECLE